MMEDLFPSLKDMLKKAIEITTDESKLAISMTVKNKLDAVVADPGEIIIMLKMYGGLREDIPMEIDIDNDAQNITLKFQNEEGFKKVEKIMEKLLDNAVDMLVQATEGDISRIKDIPNID